MESNLVDSGSYNYNKVGEKKSKAIAFLLWLLGGVYSAHNFYLGKYKKGTTIISLLFLYCIITGIVGSVLVPIFNIIYETNIQGRMVVYSSDWISALISTTVQYQNSHSILNLISLLCIVLICINLFWELYIIITEKYEDDTKSLVFFDNLNQKQEQKEKKKALYICIFGMTSFVHNFYLGRVKRGIVCVVGVSLLSWIYMIGSKINGLTDVTTNINPQTVQTLLTNKFFIFMIVSNLLVFVVWIVDFIAISKGAITDDNGRNLFIRKKSEE